MATTTISRLSRFITDNSPAILTGLGVAGALTTAYLSGTASFKAAQILAADAHKDLQPKEKFEVVWQLYIPAAGTAAITVAAIICANRIGARRAAAVAAAYAFSERALDEYKEKVKEQIGAKKEQALRDEIAQDNIRDNPPNPTQVIVTGGTVLCYEKYTGRYFTCDLETLKKAQNDTNYQVIHDSYASLSDFYDRVGLPLTEHSDNVGWNTDRQLELEFSGTITDDGKPCIAVGFRVSPMHSYSKLV